MSSEAFCGDIAIACNNLPTIALRATNTAHCHFHARCADHPHQSTASANTLHTEAWSKVTFRADQTVC